MKKKFVFLVLMFFTFWNFTTAQNALNLPFNVNFSEKEIRLLNSLSPADLEKLIRVIKLVIEKARNGQTLNTQNLTGYQTPTSSTNPEQPTIYSNSPSPQTPHYNPSTGQYQSTPQPTSLPQSSPLAGMLPFAQSQQPQVPSTPLGALATGVNQGLQQPMPFDASKAKGCPDTIPAVCEDNLGVTVTGGCSEKVLRSPPVQPKLAHDLKCVCAILGRKIVSASVYRNQSQQKCANPAVQNSQHTAGTAIDFSYTTVTPQEAMKVIFYFKSNGYRHGCYGTRTTHIHFDYGLKNNYYVGPCPAAFNSVLESKF